jgi:hypothetical protein
MRRRRLRFSAGSLQLNRLKLCFRIDESNNPIDFFTYPLKDSNRMIEEYMLLANMFVARRIAEWYPGSALLRRHAPPEPRGLEKVRAFCAAAGYPVDVSSSHALHESMLRYRNEVVDGVRIGPVIEVICTKPMRAAEYMCTGDFDESEWGHYALAFQRYTHFTSPIRRYADIVVHRLLQASLDDEARGLQPGQSAEPPIAASAVAFASEQSNRRKAAAKKAQEASDKVFFCLLLKDAPMFETAIVTDIADGSFDILVERIGVERRIRVEDACSASGSVGAEVNRRTFGARPSASPHAARSGRDGRHGADQRHHQQQQHHEDGGDEATVAVEEEKPKQIASIDTARRTVVFDWPNGVRQEVSVFQTINVRLRMKVSAPIDILIDVQQPGPAFEAARTAAIENRRRIIENATLIDRIPPTAEEEGDS